jgi:hypothetical protein
MPRALLSLPLIILATFLPAAPAQTATGKSYALLIGVRDYDHRDLDPLQYTENDVEELARLLDRPGSPFHRRVRLLTTTRGKKNSADQPTAANIRKALAELLKDRTRHETVLLALAGHGVQLQVEDPEGKLPERDFAFFCPADAQLSDVDYRTGRHPRLLSLTDTMKQLGECGAGNRLVLVDACRNQMRIRRRSLTVKKEAVPEGVAALFSCKAGEFSHEADNLKHGVFFHFVLKGLRGQAKTADGEVTWLSLAGYVTRQMSRETPALLGMEVRQSPHLVANLSGDGPVLLGQVVEPSNFAGTWTGTWTNTAGESGTETLVLKETADGNLSGDWEGIPITGKRRGENEIAFQGRTEYRYYEVAGRLRNGTLTLTYTAHRLDSGGKYYGRSIDKRSQ